MNDHRPLETTVAAWAREAGRMALDHWRGGEALTFKKGREAVTAADPAIERMLRERIAAAFPGDAIVGEELGGTAPDRGRVWHLDPIDGTLNFALGLPGFCISIALLEDGEATAACVHVPVGGDTYTAVRGTGARRNGRPIRVSGRSQALILRTLKLRKVGAIALELAWVADGSYDALVAGFGRGIQVYDVAAGLLLVREAGGTVTDHRGRPYASGGADLVASNGLVHGELCALVGGD